VIRSVPFVGHKSHAWFSSWIQMSMVAMRSSRRRLADRIELGDGEIGAALVGEADVPVEMEGARWVRPNLCGPGLWAISARALLRRNLCNGTLIIAAFAAADREGISRIASQINRRGSTPTAFHRALGLTHLERRATIADERKKRGGPWIMSPFCGANRARAACPSGGAGSMHMEKPAHARDQAAAH